MTARAMKDWKAFFFNRSLVFFHYHRFATFRTFA